MSHSIETLSPVLPGSLAHTMQHLSVAKGKHMTGHSELPAHLAAFPNMECGS